MALPSAKHGLEATDSATIIRESDGTVIRWLGRC
jgi:hypothetical protein